jgi:hypothetical protein
VRVGWIENGVLLNHKEVEPRVRRTGPFAPGGDFARLELEVGVLTWVSLAEGRGVLGCLEVERGGDFVVEAYPAHDHAISPKMWDVAPHGPAFVAYVNPARFEAPQDGEIHGVSAAVRVEPGESFVTGGYVEITGRALDVRPESEGVTSFRLHTLTHPLDGGHSPTPPGHDFTIEHNRSAWLRYRLTPGQRLHFVVETSPQSRVNTPPLVATAAEADALIASKEKAHAAASFQGTGPLGDMAGPLANELSWLSCWHPFERRAWSGVGRFQWYGDGRYNVWGWDEHFSAVMADAFSPKLARDNLHIAGDDTRVGPYAAWALFARSGDLDILRKAYPGFRARDGLQPGNRELDLECGRGMDDTPMREKWLQLGPMRGLDSACYKAFNADLMARMAEVLGLAADAEAYRADFAAIARSINDTFWHEASGIYRNRYVSGAWPVTESPTSFYPWLIGIVPPERSERMLKHLLDERRFWGEWVLPSLAKDDPQYGQAAFFEEYQLHMPAYSYWRGAIWPPPNFLVYEGLRRSGYPAVAAQLAAKSVALWRKNWVEHGIAPENYNPETGERSGFSTRLDGTLHSMSCRHQSWSMLLPFLGTRELIDIDLWHEVGSLRFGSPGTHVSTLRNYPWRGHRLDVASGPNLLTLERDGHRVFTAEGGGSQVQAFRFTETGCRFQIEAQAELRVTLDLQPTQRRSRSRYPPDATA